MPYAIESLEAARRSKYQDAPSRWDTPPDLPPFTESIFIIFRDLQDVTGLVVGRHFKVTPAGLEPLSTVHAGSLTSVAERLVPPGSTRHEWQGRRHPSVYRVWLAPHRLGLTL